MNEKTRVSSENPDDTMLSRPLRSRGDGVPLAGPAAFGIAVGGCVGEGVGDGFSAVVGISLAGVGFAMEAGIEVGSGDGGPVGAAAGDGFWVGNWAVVGMGAGADVGSEQAVRAIRTSREAVRRNRSTLATLFARYRVNYDYIFTSSSCRGHRNLKKIAKPCRGPSVAAGGL